MQTNSTPHPVTTNPMILAADLIEYDTALPQEWLNEVRKRSAIEPVGNIVWGYSTTMWASIMGLPFAITPAGSILLGQLSANITSGK